MTPVPAFDTTAPNALKPGSAASAWLTNVMPARLGTFGTGNDNVARPSAAVARSSRSRLPSSVQPGMPIGSSGAGSATPSHVVAEKPVANSTGPLRTEVSSSARTPPTTGRAPAVAASRGTPALPAQPVPYASHRPTAGTV